MFDIEEDGRIRTEELENALRIAKMNPTPSDIQQIKEGLGNAGNVDKCSDKTKRDQIEACDITKTLKSANDKC